MENEIRFVELSLAELSPDLLQDYVRHQETEHVWHWDVDLARYGVRDEHLVNDWDERIRTGIAAQLYDCAAGGGVVFGALAGERLAGFASIEGELVGSDRQYLQLTYLHASQEYRRRGIGRRLFGLCCDWARAHGARRLFMSTQPSAETQDFYQALGCVVARELDEEIGLHKPWDIPREYAL